jgi:pimeloyl-ACP methyl ester carboxylesterase
VFMKSVANLDIDGGGPDVNPARIHYVGHSMGGIVGGAHAHHSDARTVTLANPGGGFMKLALDSQAFGPLARRLAAASGVTDNSTLFNDFMLRDLQTVIDPADPINHICACAAQQPVLLLQVQGDDVVPNSATQRLVTTGSMRQLSTAGPHAVGPTEAVWVDFNAGGHGSISSPGSTIPGRSPNPAVTVEMQREIIGFAATAEAEGGPFVVITDTSVIGQP